MKKILFASTILATLGTVAAADVTISGYGRFGLQYYSGNDDDNAEKTTFETRLRMNIDAKTESDVGVTFGGRIRLQYDDGVTGAARLSPALMYASYEGLRVEIGNVNTALDSAPLFYDSEMGLTDTSFGDSYTTNYGADFGYFSTGAYSDIGRNGLSASYSVGGFSVMASYIDFDQYYDVAGEKEEYSLMLAYTAGQFTVAAAGSWNANGIDGNDVAFIGASYAISDVATVGLNYIDEGVMSDGVTDIDDTVTLYGNYTMDALTLKGYVAYNDSDWNDTSTAFGIGADYDLGGAKLTGSIQRDYFEETYADVGVRFDF